MTSEDSKKKKEKRLAQAKEYKAANREAILEYHKQYNKDYHQKNKLILDQKRKARLAGLTPEQKEERQKRIRERQREQYHSAKSLPK